MTSVTATPRSIVTASPRMGTVDAVRFIRTWVASESNVSAIACLCLLTASMSWAASLVMTKALLDSMAPFTLLFVQLTGSICVLWLAVAVCGEAMRPNRTLIWAGLSGLVEPGLVYALDIVGLSMTTATNAAMINALEPVLVIGLAWWLLRERIRPATLGVALMACVGLALVVGPGGVDSSVLGDMLIFVALLLSAFYVVLVRNLIFQMSALSLATMQQTTAWVMSLLLLLTLTGLDIQPLGLNTVSFPQLGLAALSGVLEFALPFWLYLKALKRMSANATAPYLALIPIFSVCGACLVLGEIMSSVQWVGAIVVVFAVSRFRPPSGDEGRREDEDRPGHPRN